MSLRNIVILDGYTINPGDLSWDIIKKHGSFEVYDRTAPSEVIERAKYADLILTSKVVFDEEILKKLPKLKYIGVLATGYNVIDLKATRERNIIVTNVSNYSSTAVTQLVFGHMLELARGVGSHNQSVKNGDWEKSNDFCYWNNQQIELSNRTLGIFGLGNIGQNVASIALAFGMNVIAYDIHPKNPRHDELKKRGLKTVELDTLFSESDFLTLHCPLTNETNEIINSKNIDKMKNGAFIINTGRGPLINEEDLANALNQGKLGGAGLDVLQIEPPAKNNPLLTARNCIITPHIAWASLEARKTLIDLAEKNIAAFIKGSPIKVVY